MIPRLALLRFLTSALAVLGLAPCAAAADGSFYLSFPLANRTVDSVVVNTVFDHSMTGAYCPNDVVTAYNGQQGRSEYGISSWYADYTCGRVRGFKNAAGTSFTLSRGTYSGGGQPTYLFYDGHPGWDYKTTDQLANGRVEVRAAADGVAWLVANSAYNTVWIDHGNGYKTYYLHLYQRDVANGQMVSRGQRLGLAGDTGAPGAPHLHFEVKKNDVYVDPYGWTGAGPDPYGAQSVDLWTPPATCTYAVAQGVSGSEASAITNAYNAVGGQGVLGCPTGAVGTGFTSWNGTNAHYQNFANGSIEYILNGSYAGQAFAITQPFYGKWVGLGLSSGNVMGYPVANPSAQTTSCIGTPYKFQRFEGGHLEYHMGGASSGQVYEIHGLIRSKWDALGFAGCPLGLPTSDERSASNSPQGSSGRVNDLEGGHIHYRYGDGQAYATWGTLDGYYASVGGSASCLGFPNADQTTVGGLPYATFQGGYISTTNGTTFQKSCGSASSNNAFAGAQALSGLPVRATGSNVGASKESGEPYHGGNSGGASVWWAWTAPFSAAVSISTDGSTFDTLLAVYTGSSVSALTLVAQNDDNLPRGYQQSRVQFRAQGGTTYRIAVDGYNSGSGAATGSIALRLHPAPTADLDADGRADILLWNGSTWTLSTWTMDEAGNRVNELALSPNGPASSLWQLVGTNDFNGDQKTDLVYWDSSSGQVQFWLMDGVTRSGVANLSGASPLSTSWRVAATGDFNRDGSPDLLWRNTSTQKLAIWTMSGTAKAGDLVPSPDQAVDANWAVVGALDYDGDGARDLLWYNSTSGKIVFWFMNTAVQRITGQFASPSNAGANNWKVVAAGDFGLGPSGTNDTNDILWRNETSGRLVLWYMNTSGVRTYGGFTNPNSPADALGTTVVGPK